MSTLNPPNIQIPGKLLLPALQSEMEWTYNPSQPRQGNQRVLSPGRWLSYFDIAIVRPGCPCRRHVRESLCKNTPRPWGGGVFNHFYLHSIYLGLGLLPSFMSRYGWLLWTYLSPFFCFLIPLLLPPLLYCVLSCLTLFPTMHLLHEDNQEAARLLPALSLPPLSSP